MIDLNHVRLFAKVVEAGSFSVAARALGLPKATVSRNVARLERTLGVRLMHRTTRKLELTGPGRSYYDEASRGLLRVDLANQAAAALQSVPSGTLRVTAPVEFANRYLIGWVAAFLERFASVRVELSLRDEMVDLIGERIDLAFRTGELASSSFIARKLGPARRIVLASPRYLKRRGEPRRVEDLQQHDCVVFGRALEHAAWRLDGPHGAREVPVHGRIAVDGAYAALQAAVAGLGLALLPAALAADDLRAGRLRQVLPAYGTTRGALYAVIPSNRHMSAALRAFLDLVENKAAAMPQWPPADRGRDRVQRART
jgi:DNA-binding transcriptional LysR family regulator